MLQTNIQTVGYLRHLVILRNSNTIGFRLEENVSCAMGQKLTNSLGNNNLNLDSHVIRLCILKPRQICVPAGVKKIFFLQSWLNLYHFFYFRVGRYNKTLNDWPHGKQLVLFPLDPQCSMLRVSGKNSLSPLVPVIKCLIRLLKAITVTVVTVTLTVTVTITKRGFT